MKPAGEQGRATRGSGSDDGSRQGLRPSGGFVWRTPLLPVDELHAWGAGLTAADALDRAGPGEELDAAVAVDRETLRQRLASAVERPEIRHAIAVATSSLEAAIDAWWAEPASKQGRRVERGLVRYFTRMATRPTPFGLLAGVSTGVLGERTRLTLGAREGYGRHSQIDTHVLLALGAHLGGDPALRDHLVLRPNDSLYGVAGQLRYVEARQDGPQRTYRLATLPDHPAVRRVLDEAAHGARVSELAAALVIQGHAADAARRAVDRLVDRGVLVADVGLGVTGADPVRAFIDELARHEPTRGIADRLAEADAELAAIDAAGVGATAEQSRRVAKSLRDLPGVRQRHDLLHVVLTKPAYTASLGPGVRAAVERAVTVLQAQARPLEDGPLQEFRDAFVHRYDTQEVPLVEALDGEAGVGYGAAAHPTPLLRGVPFPDPSAPAPWTRRDELLLERVGAVLTRGDHELALTDADIDALRAAGDKPALPRALAMLCTVLAQSPEAVDRGDFRLVVEAAVGPSGARLLGRFCHADEEVHRIVESHLRAEEAADPEARHAEVVHLPAGREGNVVLRPVLRSTEIPYLGRSGAPGDAQMPITDLMVSVSDGRVTVRSQRLGCRVEARLTSAHNAQRRSLPLYRFLYDLQQQDTAGDLAWEWGPLRTLPFLPRVTSRNLVLCPAVWRVPPDELADLHGQSDGARFAAVQRWRAQREIPQVVRVAQHDQRLAVDFSNVLSVDSFLHLARQHAAHHQRLVVQEPFLDEADLVADGPEGRFAHELVVPLVREGEKPPWSSISRTTVRADAPRRFPPGSSWLYAKLYAGPTTADAVLTRTVAPLRERLRTDGSATGWFFLRYGDPQWHLRLRLHGEPERLSGEALPDLQRAVAPLVGDGRISRLQLDTYEREVDALGGSEAIVHVEGLFEADSDAVVDVLPRLPRGDAGLDARWRLTLLGLHRALLDLGLDLDARRALLAALHRQYRREHRADLATEREVGRRFRQERAALDALIAPDAEPSGPLAPGVAALARRSNAWADIIGRLRTLDHQRQLTVSWPRLAERVLHLHANRLLRFAHRRQEYVLYDFLARLYDSHAARGGHR